MSHQKNKHTNEEEVAGRRSREYQKSPSQLKTQPAIHTSSDPNPPFLQISSSAVFSEWASYVAAWERLPEGINHEITMASHCNSITSHHEWPLSSSRCPLMLTSYACVASISSPYCQDSAGSDIHVSLISLSWDCVGRQKHTTMVYRASGSMGQQSPT